MKKGFSMLEVILAVAMFAVIAVTVATAVISGLDLNRLSIEQTVAMQYASEGLEAARSIRNQNFANLVNTAGTGIVRSSGVWTFSGSNNSTDSGRYTRTIAIADVCRDGSGNIIACGSPADANTKKVTSTVSWNVTPVRNINVNLSQYFTNWKAAIGVSGDAFIVYGETTSVAQPRLRTYTNTTNVFDSETTTGTSFTDTLVGKTFEIQTSPTKQEAIVGYVNNSGVLNILCFDGTSWTKDWTFTVGGTGTNDQRFGIAYEKTTGNVMVAYSTGLANPSNEIEYRTKPGSSGCNTGWSTGQTLLNPQRTTGIVHWIIMEPSPVSTSNRIYVAWADSLSDLSANVWSGSAWLGEPATALETNLERVSASQDVQSFDMAVESATGNSMIVWGLSQAAGCTAGTTIATTNCIRYARYTSSWSAVAVVPTVADPATSIDISANPAVTSNEMVLASLDNSQADLSIAYWSGSAWTGRANQDTSTQPAVAGSKLVATGWLTSGATTRYVVVYNDSATTNIGWFIGSGSGVPALQGDFTPTPAFANPQRWYEIKMDPRNSDRLMITLSDNASDLFAKRLVMTSTPAFTWTNSDGSAALETTLGQATTSPFGFAYWRH